MDLDALGDKIISECRDDFLRIKQIKEEEKRRSKTMTTYTDGNGKRHTVVSGKQIPIKKKKPIKSDGYSENMKRLIKISQTGRWPSFSKIAIDNSVEIKLKAGEHYSFNEERVASIVVNAIEESVKQTNPFAKIETSRD